MGVYCIHEKSSGLSSGRLILLAVLTLPAQAQNNPVVSWQKQADGVTLHLLTGLLRLQVWTPRVVRVTYGPTETLPNTQSLAVSPAPQAVAVAIEDRTHSVTVATGQIQAQVNRQTGAVRFLDAVGKPILSEEAGGRAMTPVTLAGPTPEAAYQSQQGSFCRPARAFTAWASIRTGLDGLPGQGRHAGTD